MRKIEYFVCSDGRIFCTEKEAKEWEECPERMNNNPNGNTISYTPGKYDIYDFTYSHE